MILKIRSDLPIKIIIIIIWKCILNMIFCIDIKSSSSISEEVLLKEPTEIPPSKAVEVEEEVVEEVEEEKKRIILENKFGEKCSIIEIK